MSGMGCHGKDIQLGYIRVPRRTRESLGKGELATILNRHRSGDRGEFALEEQDLPAPSANVRDYPVLSAFRTEGGERLWIITDLERRTTLVVLAEDY